MYLPHSWKRVMVISTYHDSYHLHTHMCLPPGTGLSGLFIIAHAKRLQNEEAHTTTL